MKKQKNIYLDYAASTPVDPRVVQAVNAVMQTTFGNPSSIHKFGLQAKLILDNGRRLIASMLHARPDEIFFTSGGSESNNLAILGVAEMHAQPGHIITSAIEHPSVLQTCRYLKSRGWELISLPVNSSGQIEPAALEKAIKPETKLISIMHVNNEIGSINDIQRCAEIAENNGIVFHTDAVQSFGKIAIDLDKTPISLMAFTGHKIYGPKGVGVLFKKRGIKIGSRIHGGKQENGLRAGTENIPAIAGLNKAVDVYQKQMESDLAHAEKLGRLCGDLMRKHLPLAQRNGGESGVPNIQNYAIPGIDNMSFLMGMDLAGIAISNGSACSSGDVSPSHVLQALRLPARMQNASIRLSFGRFTTSEEIETAVQEFARFTANR